IIAGQVTEVVKGGLRVDVGVRAFLPASRSGAKDPAEMEKLVGTEIRCRITKLDVADEDVVVDRRSILEEEQAQAKDRAFASIAKGGFWRGPGRPTTYYGALVDGGGAGGLLNFPDLSGTRFPRASYFARGGVWFKVKFPKADPSNRRISL